MPTPFRHVARDCYADAIGEAGASQDAVAANQDRAAQELAAILGSLSDDPRYACLSAAHLSDDLTELESIADSFRHFSDVLLVGIGGSALGARVVQALASGTSSCHLHVLDNLQAGYLETLLARLDAKKTGVLLVSKSGGTVEVVAQALLVLWHLGQSLDGDALQRQVLAIAAPGDSPLRQLAHIHGFPVLDHPKEVAGRYSVLTLVGMLPALILGQDAGAIRRGAQAVLRDGGEAVAEGAALMTTLLQGGKGIAVNFAYDERLAIFAQWHAQLWGESLGKSGHGMTPVTALGPLDQHSQLQLYLDGPVDKVFTVFAVESHGVGTPIAVDKGVPSVAYLENRTIGDVVSASARATVETLVARGRPVRRIVLPRVDEEALGGLFMHFMLETILTAKLIGVDPFDQPAVDEGKKRARTYLRSGRVGFES